MNTTTTTTELADIPWPVGALEVTDWSPAPNGDGFNRRFRSKAFPVANIGSVATGGYQLVGGDGATTHAFWAVTPLVDYLGHLTADQARQLALALIEAGNYTREMEAADRA
jgi:hypothetical protein